ncbi:MAG: hypothetical protein ACRDZO_16610 [Egibacteraceae bacterium]
MSKSDDQRFADYHHRVRQPAEHRRLRDLLSLHAKPDDRGKALDHGLERIWTYCTAQPERAAREYSVYHLFRGAVHGAAMHVLAIWGRFSAYLDCSARPAQHAWLCRAVNRPVSYHERDDAIQEARYRLWRQVRTKPFHCDERYRGYEQFRQALKTAARRKLDTPSGVPYLLTGSDLDLEDRRPITGIPPSVLARQVALLGGEQSRRWVIAACAGWSAEDIACAERLRLREHIAGWEVFQRVDMLRRAHHLHAAIPYAFSRDAKRHVRAWLRHSGHVLEPVDLQIAVRSLADHDVKRIAARVHLDRESVEQRREALYWTHTWFRYWLDPARAQIDRRLVECRDEVTRRYPQLDQERHVDTLAASWAGEPQAVTARRQYHAELRRRPTAGSVSSELHWLRRRYGLGGPVDPEAPRSA